MGLEDLFSARAEFHFPRQLIHAGKKKDDNGCQMKLAQTAKYKNTFKQTLLQSR